MDKNHSILFNLFFLLVYIWKINRRIYILNILKVFFDIVQSLSTVIFMRYVIHYIAIEKNIGLMFLFLGLLICSQGLAKILLSAIEPNLKKHMDLLEKQILMRVGQSAAKIDYFEMEKPLVKDLFQLALDPNKFVGVLESVIVSVSTFVSIIGIAATILAVDKILIIPLFISIVLSIIAEKVKVLNWSKWKNLVITPFRQTNYVIGLLKDPAYGKEIRINAMQRWLYCKAQENCNEYLNFKKKYDLSCRKYTIISILINFVLFSFLTLFVLYVIYKSIIQIDEAVLVVTAAISLAGLTESFSNAFSDLMKSATFVSDFRTCVDLSIKKDFQNQTKHLFLGNKENVEIVFENVTFRYPGKDKNVLQNFNLKINSGEKIAIVGLNGTGKSTIVKLLCRFYQPNCGQIYLNGKDIYDYTDEEYNSFISVVFQDYKIFSLSLKDNILLGKAEKCEKVNSVLEKSGLRQRIDNLKNGLDTFYTKEFDENGVNLSGGESQKLAIARAFYKDSPIIILDEPTASLDAVVEYEIYNSFEKLIENKTALIISHRLSSTHFCDRIVVINDGAVFEEGTHQSLMLKDSGIYKKMFTAQAAHYFINSIKVEDIN